MEKGAAGATRAVDNIFGEALEIVGVVILFVADDVDEAAPSAANANHFVAFAERAEGNGTNGRIQAGHVASACENADDTLLNVDISHVARVALVWSNEQMIIYLPAKFIKSPQVKSSGKN